jgi:glycosyltransferase 2 family protein
VPDKNKNSEKTLKIPMLISISLSVAVILVILYFTLDAETIQTLKKSEIRYEFLFIAIILQIIYWLIWSGRLQILSNAIDKNLKISFFDSTKTVLANLFLACVTPSMAGGEPVRIYLLKKEGMSTGSATGAVLGERLLDAVFMLCSVPFAFFIFQKNINSNELQFGLTIGVAFFLLLLFLFLYALKKPDKIKSFLVWINSKISRFFKKREKESRVIERINREVDNFHASMTCFVKKEKRTFLIAAFFTIIFWFTGFLIPSMILMGLGLPPFFIESIAAQILLLVIIMMPTTPGSTGVAELSVVGLYSVLIGSGSGSPIGVFMLLFRLVTFYLPFIVGAIFQYHVFKAVLSFSLDKIRNVEPEFECKP